jgi:hypothetical protein
VINNILPNSATVGDPAFTLVVNGANFASDSVVRWNGSNRTTTFVSSSQLTTTIAAGDIAAAGAVTVTVLSPVYGVSNNVTFTINSTCQPLQVNKGTDDNSCGTLRRSLVGAGIGTIINVTAPTINLTSTLKIPAGVNIIGVCNTGKPAITIKGGNITGPGLVLTGGITLNGLRIMGFAGTQISANLSASKTKNSFVCVRVG